MVTVSDPSFSSHTGLPAEPGGANGAPAMLHNLTRGAHETIDHLAEQAAPQVQRLQEKVDVASQLTGARLAALRGGVRDNPLAAICGALVLGMLVGRLAR